MKNLLVIEKNPSGTVGLKKAKEKGINIIYISENKYNNKLTDKDKEYIDEFINIDTSNKGIVLEECRKINENKKISGAVTFLEYRVPMVAEVVKEFGLSGNSVDTALKTRDKFLMRNALAEGNVPIPKYKSVSSYEELINSVEEIGFPNVIKPINMAASRNVYKNNNIEELKEHYESAIKDSPLYGVKKEESLLLEEYMDGQEFSVESVTFKGKTTIVCITKKIVKGKNTFVEVGHVVPAPIEKELEDEIKEVVRKTIKALNVENSVTHTEVKATSSGVKVVEIATRLGGDRIPELVEIALGIDLWSANLSIALGEEPDLKQSKNNGAAIYFITSNPGKITSIERTNIKDKPSYVKDIVIECKVNDVVTDLNNNSSRLGEIIVSGENAVEAEQNAKKELEKIKINLEE